MLVLLPRDVPAFHRLGGGVYFRVFASGSSSSQPGPRRARGVWIVNTMVGLHWFKTSCSFLLTTRKLLNFCFIFERAMDRVMVWSEDKVRRNGSCHGRGVRGAGYITNTRYTCLILTRVLLSFCRNLCSRDVVVGRRL